MHIVRTAVECHLNSTTEDYCCNGGTSHQDVVYKKKRKKYFCANLERKHPLLSLESASTFLKHNTFRSDIEFVGINVFRLFLFISTSVLRA